jgi:mono/diheme cytochrome c family protein
MKAVFLPLALAILAGAVQAQDVRDGKAVYDRYCAACHGPTARGDGPMKMVLTIDPTDLTGLQRANGGHFPLARVVQRIDGRDPIVAHGSEMPVYGDFFEPRSVALRTERGETVRVSPPMADLVAYLESLQR